MIENTAILTDNFGREHTYLRISITEKCNFRCTYCMPANGIPLSPKSHLMTADEVFEIAQKFVQLGVTKIRITGGEPLVRKDAIDVLTKLATLNVEISITTNGVLLDKYVDTFKKLNIRKLNISIDSLDETKFNTITRRKDFERVYNNIITLTQDDFFIIKLNCVLMKGFNENEICDFIELTRYHNLNVRFIEFMPFDGNKWNLDKLVSYATIVEKAYSHFGKKDVIRVEDAPNDTSKNFQITGAEGTFAIISTVTNPFCDSCNRIRLTANGKLKNCLFSNGEEDLLTPLRNKQSIETPIRVAVLSKQKTRGGMDTQIKFTSDELRLTNRSMIAIGG
ncbi:GTP 3',8-cyclase MoaA [Flavobacteriaceae bacterium]|nr:GTP 3',8-cyclase MoaA [Flavobacteriaceae bacterium]